MNRLIFPDNRGNGNLRLVIMKQPNGSWDENKGDRHLNVEIDGGEWNDLFNNVLEIPKSPIKQLEGEGYDKYDERQKIWFQETLRSKRYEMLGHIWDMYDDAIYLPSEINQLLEECLKLNKKTQNQYALLALEKLIYGCNEALKTKSGLRLISD